MFEGLLAGVFVALTSAITAMVTNKNNRDLTEESWARDDNAVSRRKEDLVNAGLSPTLAAGSAAGNSQPIKIENPFQAKDGANLLSALTSGAQNKLKKEEVQMAREDMSHNWAVKDAQTLLLGQQFENAKQENLLKESSAFQQSLMNSAMLRKINAEVDSMEANTKLAQQRYNLELRDFNFKAYDKYWYWNKDLPSNYSFGKVGQGIYDGLSSATDLYNRLRGMAGFDVSEPETLFNNDFYTFE